VGGTRGAGGRTILSALSALSALSCSDPGAPGNTLNSGERDIIAAVIAREDPTDVRLAPYAKLIASAISATGAVPGGGASRSAGPGSPADTSAFLTTERQMSAVALEITYDVIGADSQRHTGSLTEIVGWYGMDEFSRSVAEMFAVGAWSDDSTRIGTRAYEMSTLDDPDGFAYYAKPPAGTLGLAIGSFQLSADVFSPLTQTCGAIRGVSCEFTPGSADAEFSFHVEDLASANVYVQPRTRVAGLPAVRVRLASK
jgi:hypothetical protein